MAGHCGRSTHGEGGERRFRQAERRHRPAAERRPQRAGDVGCADGGCHRRCSGGAGASFGRRRGLFDRAGETEAFPIGDRQFLAYDEVDDRRRRAYVAASAISAFSLSAPLSTSERARLSSVCAKARVARPGAGSSAAAVTAGIGIASGQAIVAGPDFGGRISHWAAMVWVLGWAAEAGTTWTMR